MAAACCAHGQGCVNNWWYALTFDAAVPRYQESGYKGFAVVDVRRKQTTTTW